MSRCFPVFGSMTLPQNPMPFARTRMDGIRMAAASLARPRLMKFVFEATTFSKAESMLLL